MSEAKHTPGPWRVCGGLTPKYKGICDQHGRMIVDAFGPLGIGEQSANARLIAASPDMEAALAGIVASIERGATEPDLSTIEDMCLQALRVAWGVPQNDARLRCITPADHDAV